MPSGEEKFEQHVTFVIALRTWAGRIAAADEQTQQEQLERFERKCQRFDALPVDYRTEVIAEAHRRMVEQGNPVAA